MDESLRPSTLSEILDRTAEIYRARFLVFLGISALPTAALLLPAAVAVLVVLWFRQHPRDVTTGIFTGLAFAAIGLVTLPVFIGGTSLCTAGMSHAGARVVFGQLTTVRDAYRAAWQRGWRYAGLYLMETAAVWVLPYSAWILLFMLGAGLSAVAQAGGVSGGAVLAVGAVLVTTGLVTYGMWMSTRLSLAFPAAVIEQTGAWAALRRSFSLSTGARRRIFVLYLLVTALNWILYLAVVVPVAMVMSAIPAMNGPQHAQTAGTLGVFVVYGAGFVVQALTRPVYGIALMLFYYDQRIRQEGFDIEWMMLRAGMVTPAAAPAVVEAQPMVAENYTLAEPVTAELVETPAEALVETANETAAEAAIPPAGETPAS